MNEVTNFPSEFLLFLPVSVELVMATEASEPVVVRVNHGEKGYRHLVSSTVESTWRLFERTVRIDDEDAKLDANPIHLRNEIPLAWAVPVANVPPREGKFWAFFPTQSLTKISGILNAPWKVNNDRTSLIPGAYNTFVMREAATLVHEALPQLATPEDPCAGLDAWPRLVQSKDDICYPLIEHLSALLRDSNSVPNFDSHFALPSTLKTYPVGVTEELAREWVDLATVQARSMYVHYTCLRSDRVSRLNRIVQWQANANQTPMVQVQTTLTEWIADIDLSDTRHADRVLRLVDGVSRLRLAYECRVNLKRLNVILGAVGKYHDASTVILNDTNESIPGFCSVAPSIASDPSLRSILVKTFDVTTYDASDLRKLLQRHLGNAIDAASWQNFWQTLANVPAELQIEFIRSNKDRICVRRADGEWVKRTHAIVPGRIADENDNCRILIAADFLAAYGRLIEQLGVRDIPLLSSVRNKDLYKAKFPPNPDWRQRAIGCFEAKLQPHQNPKQNSLDLLDDLVVLNGWELVYEFEGVYLSKFCRFLLEESLKLPWVSFGHQTQTSYPIVQVPHPFRFWLAQSGVVRIGDKNLPLNIVMRKQQTTFLNCVSSYRDIQRSIEQLLPPDWYPETTKQQEKQFWDALFRHALNVNVDINDQRVLYDQAAVDGYVPEVVRVETQTVGLDAVFVTSSRQRSKLGSSLHLDVVELGDVALRHWMQKGARDLDKLIQPIWDDTGDAPIMIAQSFPELAQSLTPEAATLCTCQLVKSLRVDFDGKSSPLDCMYHDGTLLVDDQTFRSLAWKERIELLFAECVAAGWIDGKKFTCAAVLSGRVASDQRAKVAVCATLAEKPFEAVGRRREPLLAVLPVRVASTKQVEELNGLKLSELVLSQLGPDTLRQLRDPMRDQGLDPPCNWGSKKATSFVVEIGFPAVYATAPSTKRKQLEVVHCHRPLEDLHDYQREVFEGLERLLEGSAKKKRAVVSLPTGGGKTRVAVQAAVELVLCNSHDNPLVVWVAQTDELCEQAVQAFCQVWAWKGNKGSDLRIFRMWDQNPNPPDQSNIGPAVVVVAIQTLNSRIGMDDTDWLKLAAMVVIDECQHAITKSYSSFFRWLGGQDGLQRELAPMPIIGLSATPFRINEDESKRLADRFDNRWFEVAHA